MSISKEAQNDIWLSLMENTLAVIGHFNSFGFKLLSEQGGCTCRFIV